jgi:outer membrane protein OmpU
MKKVLFATTALVATAGVASAQGVEVSGWAEMGIMGGSGVETQFFTDIDVLFRMSGETDNGLTFGAGVDLDENGAFAPATHGGAFMFLSGNFGTVTMGDTDGALDWALTEAWVGNAGSIADDETAHAGALGSYGDGAYDGQILRYDNTFGDFGVAVSVEIDDLGVQDNGFAVGFRYGMDMGGADVGFGAGFQTLQVAGATWAPGNLGAIGFVPVGTEIDIWGVSADVSSNGFSAGVQYSNWDVVGLAGDIDHLGLGLGYTSGAMTVSANWGQWDGLGFTVSGFGLAAAYDMGGGASILAGYGSSDWDVFMPDTDTFSLGVAMSF